VSITVSTVAIAVLVHKAMSIENDPFELLAFTFYIVILALGLLEHWFLVLPIPAEALWNWSVKARKALTGPENEEPMPDTREEPQSSPARVPAVAGQDI
jgi:hypothetical protein